MLFGTSRNEEVPEHKNTIELIPELNPILEYITSEEDILLVKRAYEFALDKHKDQSRESGKPYITHVVAVAQLLIEFKLDPTSICAALLHDVIEDTPTKEKEIEELFGKTILDLVLGLTKLPKQKFVSGDVHQAENFRKMLFASAVDLRIIFIKLLDRLHNMRTLQFLPEEKQIAIAQETRDIYAPLANRLGIAKIKWELEDLAFRYLEPERYHQIRTFMAKTRRERERFVELCRKTIVEELEKEGIVADVKGRPKHFYSISQKMERQNIDFESVYDLAAIRIITQENDVKVCYHALGVVHSLWKSIQKRFKDYISIPKANMYQSIHTTVIGPKGLPLEIQIRTEEMDRIAEVGIAAHWKYKEGSKAFKKSREQFEWLHQLIDWMNEHDDPNDFIEHFKINLFPNEIYVFTPAGEVIFLPQDSTPVDFAYAIHSDVGIHCIGAKVNGKIAPLNFKLKSGDRLEILTNKKHYPSQDWVKFVKTTKARSEIKKYIKNKHLHQSMDIGKELLKQEFRKHKTSFDRFHKSHNQEIIALAKELGLKDIEQLYAHIGLGKIQAFQVYKALLDIPEHTQEEDYLEEDESRIGTIVKKAFGVEDSLKLDGLDNMLITYAKCCNPVPGDKIVGFITRGRGITVHTKDCPNLVSLDNGEERFMSVSWKTSKDASFTVRIRVTAKDRKGLFADTTSAISKMNINILSGQMEVNEQDQETSGIFILQVRDTKEINKIVRALNKIKGVTKVTRLRSSS